jgi:hypothetical protein
LISCLAGRATLFTSVNVFAGFVRGREFDAHFTITVPTAYEQCRRTIGLAP